MNWIYFATVICLFLSLFVVKERKKSYSNAINIIETKSHYRDIVIFLIVFLLIFVSACRNSFVDTNDYRQIYSEVGINFENAFNGKVERIESGFLIFNIFLNKISGDSQLLIVVTSVITIFCFILFLKFESSDLSFSLILFITQMWLSCMNGMRQILVASIVCLIWKYWSTDKISIKRSIISFLLILLLSTVHTSVLICIPLFIICRGKLFNKWIFITYLATFSLLLIPSLYEFLFNTLLADFSYASMIETENKMGILRFLISSVPIILIVIYFFKKNGTIKNDKQTCILNLCLLSFCFSILSLKMVYFSRIRIYLNIFSLVSIPYLIDIVFSNKDKKIIKAIAIILYIVLFIFQLDAYGAEISEFKLFFQK